MVFRMDRDPKPEMIVRSDLKGFLIWSCCRLLFPVSSRRFEAIAVVAVDEGTVTEDSEQRRIESKIKE